MIYAEEEAAGTRLLIDGRTCLLQVPPVYILHAILLPRFSFLHRTLVQQDSTNFYRIYMLHVE